MATQAVPDVASLKSWDEAFQYPLPTVRKLSTRLRRDIDEHRARLRSLVGASYRDLLETAERIIEMDKQIQTVEHGLSDLGRRCNSGILERADTNYTRLERTWSQKAGQEDKLRSSAQVKILAAALGVVGRLIRTEGEALQAAKLMILSRLLYKSLSEASNVPSVLERYRRSIASRRNKLLGYIDRRLAQEESSTDDVTSALASYALLTSSTAKDVLKHYLAVRNARVEMLLTVPDAAAVLAALRSYTATFVSVQGVFPKRLAETLTNLSKVTLLSDRHIKLVDELSLDIYGRWVPDDIRTFTPWVQQDNLSAQEGRQAMIEYSSDARRTLLTGLEQCLGDVQSIENILDVRKKVLGATLRMSTTTKPNGCEAQLEDYRETFMLRLTALIQQSATMEEFVARDVSAPVQSIWDLARDDFDLTSGGMRFRQTVLRQRRGHDASFDHTLAPYAVWRDSVKECWNSIQTIKTMKWDEYFEQDLEDGEDEDIAPYHEMLSEQDSARLQRVLHTSVHEAVEQLFQQVESSVQAETPQFFLRVLRDLHEQHLTLSSIIALPDAKTLIKHDLTAKLHSRLAAQIAACGMEGLEKAYRTRHYVPLELWEGSPKLPLQPLPATFRYLMTIQQEMAKTGEDIWSPAAVHAVKLAIQSQLVDVLPIDIIVTNITNANGHSEGLAESHTSTSATPAEDSTPEDVADTQEKDDAPVVAAPSVDLSLDHVQRLFDALYLTKVFSVPGSDKLGAVVDTLKTRVELQVKDIQRLEKHAADYWRKTYLLFGLLARSSSSYDK